MKGKMMPSIKSKFLAPMVVLAVQLWVYFGASFHSPGRPKLEAASHAQFAAFVEATGYVTDAEKFGWSFVQKSVYSYDVVKGATWRRPDGLKVVSNEKLPVTQVSFNDAQAYCKWAKTRLPTYKEYWELVERDDRKVVSDNRSPISSVNQVNVLGNVWELTNTKEGQSIRLAGGSFYCSPRTCHGTRKDKVLYVDQQTGNAHIGFAVVVNRLR